MQQATPKQKSILMKVTGWIAATVAAVPLTKVVESYFNLSLFSPAITASWGWMLDVAAWFSREITLPFWLVASLGILNILLIALLTLCALTLRNNLSKLKESHPLVLNDDQLHAFHIIGCAFERGEYSDIDDLISHGCLTRISAHIALDDLCSYKLVENVRGTLGEDFIDLTRAGRKYFHELKA